MNEIISQITELKQKPIGELQAKYKELLGQEPDSNNTVFLRRKIVFRMQEDEFSGLSADAKRKLEELIQKYDPANNVLLRPKDVTIPRKPFGKSDRRLPMPGSIITKNYKGRNIQVKVLENGFEYEGKIYRSLSGLASYIGGQHWNGYAFFRL